MKKRQEILQGSAALKAVLFVKYNASQDPPKEKLPCQTQPKEACGALCFTGPCIDFRRYFHCGLIALIALDLWSFPSRERTKRKVIPLLQMNETYNPSCTTPLGSKVFLWNYFLLRCDPAGVEGQRIFPFLQTCDPAGPYVNGTLS